MTCHTNRKYRSTLYFMNQNHTVSLVFRLITVIVLLCSTCSLWAKGKEEKKIWAFAYGTCLNDSVVYVSAISAIPEASIDKKNNFLNNRAAYSAQFQHYLGSLEGNSSNVAATCTVFYDTKKSRLEKKFAKLRQRAQKDKDQKWMELNAGDFNWSPLTD